jgi:hypothetical protein
MQHQTGGDDKGNMQKIGEGLGGLAGQAADAVVGMFGSMMGNMGGWWAQAAGQQQGQGGVSASFDTGRDTECRSHFSAQAQGSGGVRSYDEARPLYQFGYMAGQNPEYSGRSFDQVETDLERNWGADQQTRYGQWPSVRGMVEFGYQGGSGRASGGGSGGGFQASGGGSTSGGYQASGQTGGGSGGMHASGEVRTDRSQASADLDTSGGGFRASGEIEKDPSDGSGGFRASGEIGGTDR